MQKNKGTETEAFSIKKKKYITVFSLFILLFTISLYLFDNDKKTYQSNVLIEIGKTNNILIESLRTLRLEIKSNNVSCRIKTNILLEEEGLLSISVLGDNQKKIVECIEIIVSNIIMKHELVYNDFIKLNTIELENDKRVLNELTTIMEKVKLKIRKNEVLLAKQDNNQQEIINNILFRLLKDDKLYNKTIKRMEIHQGAINHYNMILSKGMTYKTKVISDASLIEKRNNYYQFIVNLL